MEEVGGVGDETGEKEEEGGEPQDAIFPEEPDDLQREREQIASGETNHPDAVEHRDSSLSRPEGPVHYPDRPLIEMGPPFAPTVPVPFFQDYAIPPP